MMTALVLYLNTRGSENTLRDDWSLNSWSIMGQLAASLPSKGIHFLLPHHNGTS